MVRLFPRKNILEFETTIALVYIRTCFKKQISRFGGS